MGDHFTDEITHRLIARANMASLHPVSVTVLRKAAGSEIPATTSLILPKSKTSRSFSASCARLSCRTVAILPERLVALSLRATAGILGTEVSKSGIVSGDILPEWLGSVTKPSAGDSKSPSASPSETRVSSGCCVSSPSETLGRSGVFAARLEPAVLSLLRRASGR